MELLPRLQKPKYPPELSHGQDDCVEIRDALRESEAERLTTSDSVRLRKIKKDIERFKAFLEECESSAVQRSARTGNLDAAQGDWLTSGKLPVYNIPFQAIDRFVDRPELARLLTWLTGDTTKGTNTVCIYGAVGVGKSALAFYFAQQHYRDRFPDGALYQDISSRSSEEIARLFLKQCRIPISNDDDAVDLFIDWCRTRRILFILDNADNSEIQEILSVGRQSAVIITTRDKLFCEGYQMQRIWLKPFSSAENGIELLKKTIGETGEQLIASELEAAYKIVELVGNLPLALSIAGSTLSLGTLSLFDYANHLDRAKLDVLSIKQEHRRNVRACFQISIQQLQPSLIDFFACLSVCSSNGFTAEVAIAVGGQSEFDTRFKFLLELCRYFLIENDEIQQENQEVQRRYRFQTLLREFAEELAAQRMLLESAQQRHEEFIHKIREIKTLEDLATKHPREIIKNLDNILYAATWLKDKKLREYSFAFNFCPFFDRNNAYRSKAVQLMSTFRELAESVKDWEYSIRFRVQQAKYMDRSTSAKRQQILELLKPINQLLHCFESPNKVLVEGRYRNTYADVLGADKQYSKAILQLRQAISLYQNHPQWLAKAQTSLGNMLRKQHMYSEAISELRIAVRLEEEMFREGTTRSEAGWATALTDLGIALGNLKEEFWEEAAKTLEHSINLKRILGQKGELSLSYSLNELGELSRKRRQFKAAEAFFEESLSIKIKLNIKDTDGIEILKKRWLQLIQDILIQENRENALRCCDQAIRNFPKNHRSQFLELKNELI